MRFIEEYVYIYFIYKEYTYILYIILFNISMNNFFKCNTDELREGSGPPSVLNSGRIARTISKTCPNIIPAVKL